MCSSAAGCRMPQGGAGEGSVGGGSVRSVGRCALGNDHPPVRRFGGRDLGPRMRGRRQSHRAAARPGSCCNGGCKPDLGGALRARCDRSTGGRGARPERQRDDRRRSCMDEQHSSRCKGGRVGSGDGGRERHGDRDGDIRIGVRHGERDSGPRGERGRRNTSRGRHGGRGGHLATACRSVGPERPQSGGRGVLLGVRRHHGGQGGGTRVGDGCRGRGGRTRQAARCWLCRDSS